MIKFDWNKMINFLNMTKFITMSFDKMINLNKMMNAIPRMHFIDNTIFLSVTNIIKHIGLIKVMLIVLKISDLFKVFAKLSPSSNSSFNLELRWLYYQLDSATNQVKYQIDMIGAR